MEKKKLSNEELEKVSGGLSGNFTCCYCGQSYPASELIIDEEDCCICPKCNRNLGGYD